MNLLLKMKPLPRAFDENYRHVALELLLRLG